MKIIAQDGPEVFLLELGQGRGQVLDLKRKTLFPPFNLQSLLANMPWQEYTGPQDILPGLLEQVSPAPPKPAAKPRSKEEILEWMRQKGLNPQPPESDE